MSSARYVVGIDLGTTNSSLAYVALDDPQRRVASLPIVQLVREAQADERSTLPSFLYLAGKHDVAPGALRLPWDEQREYAVGEFAREQGAKVPGHLVSSAKSWLCHGGVDRQAAILPWGGADDVAKVSPVDASSRYLQHLREVWDRSFPQAPLAQQDVILTVPASFDEVARELTVAAAERAGLARVILLEEPQAAFYAWLRHHEDDWADALGGAKLAVVVDVGGGTTDFSLIGIGDDDGRIALARHAVGDHILLGGDNIDVALARQLEPRLNTKLDSQRWHQLTNLCRSAKEALLADDAPASLPIRLVGRGGAVVGGTVTAQLTADEVRQLVLDGFFADVAAEEQPRKTARAGLQEWGLPFAAEPEITRHLAAFLQRHAGDVTPTSDLPLGLPDAVLFNGGALKPRLLRDRLADCLQRWSGQAPRVLVSDDLDLAVARGAAYYGLVRRGHGIRIGGGSPRAYFVGLDAAPAADQLQVLCIAHRGMHEGDSIEVHEPAFDVLTNRGVAFPLFASSTRLGDRAGDVIQADRDSLTELPPIRTVLRFGKKLEARKIPVSLLTQLTELGTLELWCRSRTSEHRWRLQFQLREQGTPAADEASVEADVESVVSEAQLAGAIALVQSVFPPDAASGAGDPVTLMRELESALGAGKDAWPLAAIRKLWDVLWEGREHRRNSAAHEARWLNLCGFLLRPGFGAELDEWRVQQLWRARSDGLCFPKAVQVRSEWWSLWKRLAGGLSRPQQMQLFQEIAPALLPRAKAKSKLKASPQEVREFWQIAASCERLSPEAKTELGEVLVAAMAKGKASENDLWLLGRLGARAPIHGPLNQTVPRTTAEKWVRAVLAAPWPRPGDTVFALVQLARCVGDRERDLDPAVREAVALFVQDLPHGERAAHLVRQAVPLAAGERSRILDESLPAGLQLRSDG